MYVIIAADSLIHKPALFDVHKYEDVVSSKIIHYYIIMNYELL